MLKKKLLTVIMALLFGSTALGAGRANGSCEKKEGVEDHILLFSSDIHEQTDTNLKSLLSRFRETEDKVDYICYGGDYAPKFNADEIAKTHKLTKQYFPESSILMTTGNHDRIGFEEKEFKKSANQKAASLSVEEKGYCIYMLGASTKEQVFTDQEMEALKVFLDKRAEVIPKIPVFIVSHYPIHYYKGEKSERLTKNAKKMVELLNQYSNVIFLYGHNHTLKDENYEVIHMPGDDLQIGKDLYIGIHFPYTSMGAIKDGAGLDIYGLKITIEHTMCCNKVVFEHVNQYAEPKDKMMICFPIVE